MTTLEPGASVVFTQGLRDRPLSTAFLASSAAPIITDGLEVFVHELIAAITTAPWSSSYRVPSSAVTWTGSDGRPSAVAAESTCGAPRSPSPLVVAGEAEAGKDSATASSTDDSTPPLPSST